MKNFFILSILLLQTVVLQGQGTITGSIVDKATQSLVEYANIALYTQNGHNYVLGTVTDVSGKFSIENIAFGNYELEYSFLGFEKTETLKIRLDKNHSVANVGILELAESFQTLDEVVVMGRKSTYVTQIDKKIFNVGEDLMSSSGSASDLLENIPSVQVDLDGNVSLRGSENVQILINGKTSNLMGATRATVLQQIPAKTIDRVEVITNPSAKYKPDGTSGIINIVLRKERKKGMNGTVAANAGNSDRYNGTLSLNYNPGKINIFGSYGIRQDNRNRYTYDNRTITNTTTGQNTYIDQNTNGPAHPVSQLVQGGVDWYMTKKDNFQVNGSYSYTNMLRNETTFNTYRNNSKDTTNYFSRFRRNDEYEENLELSAAYEHKFGEDHTFTIDYTHSSAKELEDNAYTNSYFFPQNSESKDHTSIWQDEEENLIRADYTRPLGEKSKIEVGAELELDNTDMDYSAEDLRGNVWTPNDERTNHFVFDENIYALYGTYEAEFGNFGFMGGLRGEIARIQSKLISAGTVIPNNYSNFYPTLHTSYRLDEKNELQLNYSLRVNRPEGDDLNPFPEYKDPLNVSSGNPYLKPEKIHSIELGYLLKSNATTFVTTLYYRDIFNRMTEVSKFINDSVMWTTKENMSSNQSAGMELILNSTFGKWANINFNSHIFYDVIDASDLGFSDKKSTVSWNASLNGNFNVTKNLLTQVNTRFTAKSLTPQGYREPAFILNMGVRYNLLPNKASILFTVSDLLNTYKSVLNIDTPELVRRLERKRTSQIFYWGFTYHFGSSSKKKETTIKYDEHL